MYILRFTQDSNRSDRERLTERPHWMHKRSRGSAWLVSPFRHEAKVWKTREAAERNAARFTSGPYVFVVEEF